MNECLFMQVLNVESSLLRIGFWPFQESVDPWLLWHSTKLLLKFRSKLRLEAGPCALAVQVWGQCSSLRGVRHEPGPETAVQSIVACGVRFPLHLFLYMHLLCDPMCVRSNRYLGCLTDQAPLTFFLTQNPLRPWGFHQMTLTHQNIRVKRVCLRLASLCIHYPFRLECIKECPSDKGSLQSPPKLQLLFSRQSNKIDLHSPLLCSSTCPILTSFGDLPVPAFEDSPLFFHSIYHFHGKEGRSLCLCCHFTRKSTTLFL